MRRFTAFLPLVVLGLAIGTVDCGSEAVPTAPNSPSPAPPRDTLTVTSVQPSAPFPGDGVTVVGAGFVTGAQVRLGAEATLATVQSGNRINVTTPLNAAGTVDVIVTNPDGQSATLPAALTYNAATLNPSRTVLAPGDEVTVAWSVVATRCSLDWIGMFVLGEMNNTNYGPWDYTACGTSGVVRLVAPAVKGQYQFRYLPNDDYRDVARSVTITVE